MSGVLRTVTHIQTRAVDGYQPASPQPRSRRPRQAVGQESQHILLGAFAVQRHADREVRHDTGRQRPAPQLGPSAISDHLVDQRRRERAGQHPNRDNVRQPPVLCRLPPTTTGDNDKLHRRDLS